MTHVNQTIWNLDQGPAVVRALSSLRHPDVIAISNAVVKLGAGWTVQTCDDYDGYLSILIEPAGSVGSSYLISGTIKRVELAELCDDSLTTIGAADSVPAAIERLLQALKTEG